MTDQPKIVRVDFEQSFLPKLDHLAEIRPPSTSYQDVLQNAVASKSGPPPKVGDRKKIVEQALVLMENFYVNRPLKESTYAAEPIRRLQLLASQLSNPSSSSVVQDERAELLQFHYQLCEIFTSVRDRHVGYSLSRLFNPKNLEGSLNAYLGFEIEAFYEPEVGGRRRRKYMVSHVDPGLSYFRPGKALKVEFKPGVEVVAWNGVSIARAVDLNAARQSGGNPAARHARGVSLMTLRPLEASLPPDEDHVIVRYMAESGTMAEILFVWQVVTFRPPIDGVDLRVHCAGREEVDGLDFQGEAIQQMRRTFFGPRGDNGDDE